MTINSSKKEIFTLLRLNGDIHYSQTKVLGWRKMEFSSLFRLQIFFNLPGNFNFAQTEKFKIEQSGNFHFAHS